MSKSPARLALAVLAVLLVAFGCASPPEAEKKAADEAMKAARAAEADRYAASDFAAATGALKTAEAQMADKKYSEAKTAYVKAKDLAEKATKAAEAGKAAMKSQVEQELAQTEKRWHEVEGKVKPAVKKLKAEQRQLWEADAKAATETLEAAKATIERDPAGAKDKLATITASAEKWESELKAMAEPKKAEKKK